MNLAGYTECEITFDAVVDAAHTVHFGPPDHRVYAKRTHPESKARYGGPRKNKSSGGAVSAQPDLQ